MQSISLNPFGVREVSKLSTVITSFFSICLNPFGVREVSKLTSRLQKTLSLGLNPFGVREVSKQDWDSLCNKIEES